MDVTQDGMMQASGGNINPEKLILLEFGSVRTEAEFGGAGGI